MFLKLVISSVAESGLYGLVVLCLLCPTDKLNAVSFAGEGIIPSIWAKSNLCCNNLFQDKSSNNNNNNVENISSIDITPVVFLGVCCGR